jgi:DMSO/TMAO reductase YedYZ molybdopterin-dependent catalytic subunit
MMSRRLVRAGPPLLLFVALVALALWMLSCSGSEEPSTTTSTAAPVVTPTLPAVIPASGEVDPATGLHMTGTPQVVDAASYRLKVTGKVDKELSLSYGELLALPKQTATPTLLCPGEFTDTATWSGVSLHTIIEMAGVQPGAVSLVMSAADGYATTISLVDALLPQNFLAYELEGKTLPALHGFPVRAVFPDEYGAYWVKWLLQIEVR